jgi:pimeloyl-ACP methyl ester carboxylesterase
MLRGAALPGASALLAAAANPRVLGALAAGGARMRERGHRKGVYLQQIARALRPLEHADARKAFLHTLRSVIDVRGQRVSAVDRLYLLSEFPTLVVWGERDNTIPLSHGRATHEAVPGSRFETLPRAAHFPHLEDPEGLAAVLADWLDTTTPAQIDDADWGRIVAREPRRRFGAVKAA